MRMIEVFTTNVQETAQANDLISTLRNIFPDYLINFDLEDCDRILRVEGHYINSNEIIKILNAKNFSCEVLNEYINHDPKYCET